MEKRKQKPHSQEMSALRSRISNVNILRPSSDVDENAIKNKNWYKKLSSAHSSTCDLPGRDSTGTNLLIRRSSSLDGNLKSGWFQNITPNYETFHANHEEKHSLTRKGDSDADDEDTEEEQPQKQPPDLFPRKRREKGRGFSDAFNLIHEEPSASTSQEIDKPEQKKLTEVSSDYESLSEKETNIKTVPMKLFSSTKPKINKRSFSEAFVNFETENLDDNDDDSVNKKIIFNEEMLQNKSGENEQQAQEDNNSTIVLSRKRKISEKSNKTSSVNKNAQTSVEKNQNVQKTNATKMKLIEADGMDEKLNTKSKLINTEASEKEFSLIFSTEDVEIENSAQYYKKVRKEPEIEDDTTSKQTQKNQNAQKTNTTEMKLIEADEMDEKLNTESKIINTEDSEEEFSLIFSTEDVEIENPVQYYKKVRKEPEIEDDTTNKPTRARKSYSLRKSIQKGEEDENKKNGSLKDSFTSAFKNSLISSTKLNVEEEQKNVKNYPDSEINMLANLWNDDEDELVVEKLSSGTSSYVEAAAAPPAAKGTSNNKNVEDDECSNVNKPRRPTLMEYLLKNRDILKRLENSPPQSQELSAEEQRGIDLMEKMAERNKMKVPAKPTPKPATKQSEAPLRMKPQKLYTNRKRWCNARFYKYLQSKMENKYGVLTVLESENLMKIICEHVAVITKSKKYLPDKVGKLKQELARGGIIVHTEDFFRFVGDYLPQEFKEKVVPMTQAGTPEPTVPFDKNTLYTPIQF